MTTDYPTEQKKLFESLIDTYTRYLKKCTEEIKGCQVYVDKFGPKMDKDNFITRRITELEKSIEFAKEMIQKHEAELNEINKFIEIVNPKK